MSPWLLKGSPVTWVLLHQVPICPISLTDPYCVKYLLPPVLGLWRRATSLMRVCLLTIFYTASINPQGLPWITILCGFPSFNSISTLLLLSHFSRVRGLQSCPILCDPIDTSPPGSPVPGILQARTLEWGAIAFSDIHSTMLISLNLWTPLPSHQASEKSRHLLMWANTFPNLLDLS